MQSPSMLSPSPCKRSPQMRRTPFLDILPGIHLEMLDICPKEEIIMEGTVPEDSLGLAFALTGEAGVEFARKDKSVSFTVIPNTCILFHNIPSSTYHFSLMRKVKTNMLSIQFSPQQLKAMLGVSDDVSLDTIICLNECMTLNITQKTILHQMFSSTKNGMPGTLYTRAKSLELLSNFIEPLVAQTHAARCAQSDFYLSIEEIGNIKLAGYVLESTMIDPPSLSELAHRVGLSVYKLKLGFHAVYNTTPFAYLREARMLRAGSLLGGGHMNVSQVAWEVGYTNLSHFSAAFLHFHGVNPKTFQMAKAQENAALFVSDKQK